MSGNPLSDQRLENAIGIILRAGIFAATLFVLAGGIGFLVRHAGNQPAFSAFHGEPEPLKSASAIISGIRSHGSTGWIQFGLILLIATPVIRVFFSVLGFALQRDYVYVAITVVVALALLYSLLGGS